ncbi:mechanosensitive ion channel [bacterium]|nr:mechanosensitive ion channel [bacterium]
MIFTKEELIELTKIYGYKLVVAIIILIVGFWLAKMVTKGVKKLIEKRGLAPELKGFLGSVVSIGLKAAVVITALSNLGVEMTSFVALIGAAGLAVGMALSGTLQNFAGGVMILIFKPFKVGDYVEMQGHAGTVREIQIFHTVLMTPDNRKIIIPNAPVSTGSMTNYSAEATRRVDFVFGIGYDDDIDEAKKILNELIAADERILNEPAPFVAVKELADSSVNFVVRTWVNASDYWGVYFDMQEKVKKTFDQRGVGIPFPQMDVHMKQQ